jgi:acetate kinase
LGNGCSATAVHNGASVDTTMGLTPLEGLVMGTRSGDVDPGLHNFLSATCGWSLTQIMTVLNRESGLLGLSQLSHDMRTLIQAAPNNPQAALAIDVFCFRLARHLAGLAASLTRIDALIFSGGIGENAPLVRAKVIAGLAIFGFQLDSERNQNLDESGVITDTQGPRALVIATHEEWMIAQECVHRLSTSEEHH